MSISSSNEAKWYVVHTYSGYENKVKTNLEKIIENRGISDLIMEVSSHALCLDRVAGLHYEVAAFTNLTEDHLDFHKIGRAHV